MGNVLPLNDSGDGLQGCADETIAWSVDGEFVESARHQASVHQLMTLGGQDVDPATHAIDYVSANKSAPVFRSVTTPH